MNKLVTAARGLVATLAIAPLAAQLNVPTPGPYWTQPTPAGFEIPIQLSIKNPDLGLDLNLSSTTQRVQDSPIIYDLPQIPGGAWVFQDIDAPARWSLLMGSVVVPFDWDASNASYFGTVAGFTVRGHYDPWLTGFLPQGGYTTIHQLCAGEPIGIKIIAVGGAHAPEISFRQFVTATMRYELNGMGPALDAEPGTTVDIPGHVADPLSVDGSTTVTDAYDPMEGGNYPCNPQQGNTRWMLDGPGIVNPDSVNWNGPSGGPPKNLSKLIFEFRYVTYVLENDVVVYRYEWDCTACLDPNDPDPHPERTFGGPVQVGPNTSIPTGAPAPGMSFHHQAAFDGYNSTPPDYQGEPLPPGVDR